MSFSGFKAVDFFCGGGGMTCGLCQAQIDVIAGVDCDIAFKDTYECNNPHSRFIAMDINELSCDYFEKEFGLAKNDDTLIFVGCSPCQYYSIINTNRIKSIKTKDLLLSFARFVEYYRPGFIVVENVPGIVTNKYSILPEFIKKIHDLGYGITKNEIAMEIVNMSSYGVPQNRKRFSLIATRVPGIEVHLPVKDKSVAILEDYIGEKNGFHKIYAGQKDTSDFNHSCAKLSEVNLERIRRTRHNGGSRSDWAHDIDLQLLCYEGKDDKFIDNYGRMSWNKPAPTITTRFLSISNGRFGHPDEDRAISVREGATIQTFPKSYVFRTSSMSVAARMIGNAVPCEYARRIGETIKEIYSGKHE